MKMRVEDHPILGVLDNESDGVRIVVDGEALQARPGEVIAATLMAHGRSVFRYTNRRGEPRNLFCGIGRCTDCVMTVDGIPNVRTCVTVVRDGMVVETQRGNGAWGRCDDGR